MATHLYEHRAAPPRSRLAWLASLAVHAGCLAVLVYVSWNTWTRGRSATPGADDGMVLGLADGVDAAIADAPIPHAAQDPLDATPPADPLDDGGLSNSAVTEPLALANGAGADATSALLAPEPRPPLVSLGLDTASAGSLTPGSGPGSGSLAAGGSSSAPRRGAPRLAELAEKATVTVFGAVGEGSRFVYLFDHSTSMSGAPLAAAKQQLIDSLDALSSVHQFQVIFFNDRMQAWDLTGGQNRVPFASDANKQLAAQFVRGVIATGGTDRLTPLRRSLAMNVDVVFFLTDADDAMPSYDVAEVIERAQSTGTAIACIEFGEGPRRRGSQNFLTRLAAATGGDYVYVDVTKLGRR
jgi:hypothetical protein